MPSIKRLFFITMPSLFLWFFINNSIAKTDYSVDLEEIPEYDFTDSPRKVMTTEEFNRIKMSDIEMQDFEQMIVEEGREVTSEIKNKKMPAIVICSYATLFNLWSENINIEPATGISKFWFKKVASQLMTLANSKNKMEVASVDKDKELLIIGQEEYEKALDGYLDIIRVQKIKAKIQKKKYL